MKPEFLRRVQFARRVAAGELALRLYGILDAEGCARRNVSILTVAAAWKAAGVRLIQYRDKVSAPAALEDMALELRAVFPRRGDTVLLLNDSPELALRCDFDGVHVGQTDHSVQEARDIVGADRIVGVSTHTPDEALQADGTDSDYVAVGPVFSTSSKADAAPVVGLCGVGAARAVVRKPLIAIGGIGIEGARQVLDAGASAVAVISGLLPSYGFPGEVPTSGRPEEVLTKLAQDFLLRLK